MKLDNYDIDNAKIEDEKLVVGVFVITTGNNEESYVTDEVRDYKRSSRGYILDAIESCTQSEAKGNATRKAVWEAFLEKYDSLAGGE